MSPSTKICEELYFTQQLGDTEENVRNKAVKKLKNFLSSKSSKEGFSDEDFIKIWKGLYYCMYMSDKPLVQEDLAEEISNLIHCVSTNSQKLSFFKALLQTVAREWIGIDKYRYDKFLMLITRSLRQMLIFLSKISWNKDVLKNFCDILECHIVCPSDDKNVKPLELKMHISDVILEELAKVGKEELPDRVLIEIICPFLKVLAKSSNNVYVLNVTNRILHALIKQSELGLEYEEDLTSKEVIVFPKGTQKKLKDKEMESDEENEEKDEEFVMDPRIGGVDVNLPPLRPDYKKVAGALESIAHDSKLSREKRKNLFLQSRKFRLLAEGVYPFNFPVVEEHMKQKDISKQAFKRLVKFDEEICSKRREIVDEKDIEEIENNQPMEREGKIKKEWSKKKEANIRRSKTLQIKKKRKLEKMNKLKKHPKTLQKFLQKEKIEKLEKLKRLGKLNKYDTKALNSYKYHANGLAVNSDVEVKTGLQSDTSCNVKSKENKVKKSADKLNISNEEKFVESNLENTGKVKVLRPSNVDKTLRKNAKTVQKISKNISSPESAEKNLKKEDPWKEPLKEGEIEFNVTKKKYSKKVKSGMLMRKTPNVNTKGKTLKINLKKNTEHEFVDYKVALKQSPGIPFSAQKKPLPSVLKSSNSPNLIKKSKKLNSRINFIKRRSKI